MLAVLWMKRYYTKKKQKTKNQNIHLVMSLKNFRQRENYENLVLHLA